MVHRTAVPTDAEVNWPRTPETDYVWLEQVETDGDEDWRHHPIAVNRHGQILFHVEYGFHPEYSDEMLWSSATQEWVDLAPGGSQEIEVSDLSDYPGLDLTYDCTVEHISLTSTTREPWSACATTSRLLLMCLRSCLPG